MFCFKLCACIGYFYPLEVVGLGSETQLQVGKNWNYLIQRDIFIINAQLIYTIQIQRHIQSITQKVKIGIES